MIDRRLLLQSGAALLAATACSRRTLALDESGGNPLPIPPVLDARQNERSFALRAQAGTTFFYPGRPSDTLGYNGTYLGPTIRVRRGDDVKAAVTNDLNENTTVHWHGLLVPRELDGDRTRSSRPALLGNRSCPSGSRPPRSSIIRMLTV